MEKEAVIEGEAPAAGDSAAASDTSAAQNLQMKLRRAEEEVRLLEQQNLFNLREAADSRRSVEEELARVHRALEEAEQRVVELEDERDEIRALLEKFLAENWGDLTENTPVSGVPKGLASFLVQGAEGDPPVQKPSAAGARGVCAGAQEASLSGPPESKEDLSAALHAGATIETTEAFSRFEPVRTSHIKVSDWLQQAHDFAALRNLARDEVSEQELVSVLYLFLQKAFIRVGPG